MTLRELAMAKRLIDEAHEARRNAYAPYSHYTVGAALMTNDGRVFRGCNVENSSYGATICAERVAMGAAVAEGEHLFTAIAIVGGPEIEHPSYQCFPCGICRQALSEFCDQNTRVFLEDSEGFHMYEFRELIPTAFEFRFHE